MIPPPPVSPLFPYTTLFRSHHRPDYAISAPDVVLTGIGAKTERIKLISAVTVLSSDDPVRVHQRFATLDGITSGRAEVSLGRGSFIESFPRSEEHTSELQSRG